MTSDAPGRRTFPAEVTNVSPHGFWLLLDDREIFVAFEFFPWFRDATIAELAEVQRPAEHRLRWPSLDIDLAVESIEQPEKYPLVSAASVRPAAPETGRSRHQPD